MKIDKKQLNNIEKMAGAAWFLTEEIVSDDKRGHWGTEKELALDSAVESLKNAVEQIRFLQASK